MTLRDERQAKEYVLLEMSAELRKLSHGLKTYGLPSGNDPLKSLPNIKETNEVYLKS